MLIAVVLVISILSAIGISIVIIYNNKIKSKWKIDNFDIIIQAGQSNSEGTGYGNVNDEYVEDERVLYLNPNFKIEIAKEAVHNGQKCNNFSLSFAREYIKDGKLKEGRKLLIIRAAVGGTGFLDGRWTKDGNLTKKMHKLIKSALELNTSNKLVALLWHQGETDAILGANKDLHYNNLTGLVNSVRDGYGNKNLPFIAGDFVNEWKTANIEICNPVVDAIRSVCNDLPASRFVETADLLSNNQAIGNGDTIHFSRESLNILGERYYQAYKMVVDNL